MVRYLGSRVTLLFSYSRYEIFLFDISFLGVIVFEHFHGDG